MTTNLQFNDWLALFMHFMGVSLLAVGGAVTVIPEMHRYLVGEKTWLSELQFSDSIAIAQSAPGPNILVVAMLGWNIGINTVPPGYMQYWMGLLGLTLAMIGVMLPSSFLTYFAAKWVQSNKDSLYVIAFKQGLAPIVVSAILATSWIISAANNDPAKDWPVWLCTLMTVVLIWKTKIHILILLFVGGLLGGLGYL